LNSLGGRVLKERILSYKSGLKTFFLSKILLVIGIILAFLYIFSYILDILNLENANVVFHYLASSKINEIILAFSILSIGLGIIVYFFYTQFKKLSDIAEEIESGKEED